MEVKRLKPLFVLKERKMGSRLEKSREIQEKIEDEKRKEHQKKIVKVILKGIVFLFFASFLFCLYVSKIGTVKLIVKEEMIRDSRIPSSFHGYKIIQFSDLHYQDDQLLQDVIKEINVRKPDLILFTGDLIGEEKLSSKERDTLIKELKKLDSTALKYAVLGEDDKDDSISILNDCGFTILDNSYDLLYHDDNHPILLMGANTNKEELGDLFSYYDIPNHNDTIFSILMLHKPDYIDSMLEKRKVDLALAGHSHLGEVRIPHLLTLGHKKGAKKYQDAYYEIDDTKFYISSGIGTDIYHYRVFARPSIQFFRFSSKAS